MAYTPSYILELTRSAFRQEADELLTELDSALLQLEVTPTDSESINRAFRAMHTLKGSGATAGFKEVSAVLHDVEDIFNDARAGRVNMSSQVIDYVLRASDIVRRMTLSSPADAAMLLNDGMKVAKIAAAPMLRMIGMRLPNSAQVKPPIDSRAIAIKMSDGTVPVAANPPITTNKTRKIGSGMMPILKSTIDHQPFGQKPSALLCPIGVAFSPFTI